MSLNDLTLAAQRLRPEIVRFGEFEADLRTSELRRHGRRIRLPHQSFLALSILATKPRELVTREELRARLWPADTLVEYEQGLNAVINRLREALGDSAADPKFIETLPRRGYRFIAPVEPVPGPAGVEATEGQTKPFAPPKHTNNMSRPRTTLAVAVAAVIVTALAAVAIRFSGRDEPSPDSFTAHRLLPFTSLPGEERSPTFSPDGQQIAFAWNGDRASARGFDLYVKTVGAERILRLTDRPAKWLSAAWSPDGAHIAFARSSEADSGIFLLPALGGSERRMATAVFTEESFLQLAWSPDGKLLAYSALDASGAHRIHLLALDGSESRPLQSAPECLHAGLPAFSPDGKQLALVCTTSVAVYGIYLAALPHGAPKPLASMMGEPRGLAWVEDGSHLLVANDAGDGGSLWQLALDGASRRLPYGEGASALAASKQSERIAYVRGDRAVDIWRIDLQSAQPEASARTLIVSTRSDMTPRYSPDGTRIAFQSNRSGAPELWIADADGANPVQLTTFGGPLTGGPNWCSDGRRLAFDSRASGVSAIYVADIHERLPRKLSVSVDNLSLPAWSEDCRWIIASDTKSRLFRVPAEGGDAVRFTEQPSYYAEVSGARVVFNVKEAQGVRLWSKGIEGGVEQPLENMPRLSYADAWATTLHAVYYTSTASGHPTLHLYDFETRAARPVARLPGEPIALGGLGLSVSKDGRWLLYTQAGDTQSDVMLLIP